MQTLDRLDWAAGMALAGDGVCVGIRCNDASVMDRIRICVPPTWRHTDDPSVEHLYSVLVREPESIPRAHHLFINADRRRSSRDLTEVLDSLESDLHVQA